MKHNRPNKTMHFFLPLSGKNFGPEINKASPYIISTISQFFTSSTKKITALCLLYYSSCCSENSYPVHPGLQEIFKTVYWSTCVCKNNLHTCHFLECDLCVFLQLACELILNHFQGVQVSYETFTNLSNHSVVIHFLFSPVWLIFIMLQATADFQ